MNHEDKGLFSSMDVSYRRSLRLSEVLVSHGVKDQAAFIQFQRLEQQTPGTHLNETRKPHDIKCNLKLKIYNHSKEFEVYMKQM